MALNRWWHAAVLAMAALLVSILLLSGQPPARVAVGLGVITFFLSGWAFLVRRAFADDTSGLPLTAVVVVTGLVGTAVHPNFATFQAIAFPILWMSARGVRQAVIANVALAASVGAGFFLSPADIPLVEIVTTELLSLGFSLALGLWITHIATLSEERQELLDRLQSAQAALEAASRDAGITSERERLARDIHDTIAQDLTGLVMLAQRARQETDATARATQLAQLEETARNALTETRALIADGAPASLDAGLVAALERLTSRFSRETGIDITLTADDTSLDRGTEVVVLRCTQEALSNVRKHSGATSVAVTLGSGALTIADNGHGFDPSAPSNGYGLSGMRDRLALAGGSLEVASGASGTTLTVTFARVDA